MTHEEKSDTTTASIEKVSERAAKRKFPKDLHSGSSTPDKTRIHERPEHLGTRATAS